MKQPGGGQALLFEHVILDDGTRASYPVAINLFGSMRRMAMALGVDDLDDIARRITELLELKVPDGMLAKLALLPRLLEVAKFPPRVRGAALRRARQWSGGATKSISGTCRSSRAGRRTAVRTSRCRW